MRDPSMWLSYLTTNRLARQLGCITKAKHVVKNIEKEHDPLAIKFWVPYGELK